MDTDSQTADPAKAKTLDGLDEARVAAALGRAGFAAEEIDVVINTRRQHAAVTVRLKTRDPAAAGRLATALDNVAREIRAEELKLTQGECK